MAPRTTGAGVLAGAAVIALVAYGGLAANVCWSNGTANGNWENVGNWSTYALPGPADDVFFTQDFGASQVAVMTSHEIGSLNLSMDLPAGQTWSLGSVQNEYLNLTLSSGNLYVSGSGGSRSIRPQMVIPASVTDAQWQIEGESPIFVSTITLQSPASRLVKTGAGELTVASVLGGASLSVREGSLKLAGRADASVELASGTGRRSRLGGSGQIVGSLNVTGGDVSLAGPSSVLSTGDLTFGPGSSLEIELGPPAGGQNRLAVSGHVRISQVDAPTLLAEFIDAPAPGQQFMIVENDSNDPINGYFAELPEHGILQAMFEGQPYRLQITYCGGDGNDVVLTAASGSLLGDANADGVVDQADYTAWYNHYGQSDSGPANGDFDSSGTVDQADYTIWYNHYGLNAYENPPVAEPATCLFLAAAMAARFFSRGGKILLQKSGGCCIIVLSSGRLFRPKPIKSVEEWPRL